MLLLLMLQWRLECYRIKFHGNLDATFNSLFYWRRRVVKAEAISLCQRGASLDVARRPKMQIEKTRMLSIPVDFFYAGRKALVTPGDRRGGSAISFAICRCRGGSMRRRTTATALCEGGFY
jgi:hypothetical protein